jgi:hypothetical protein
LDSLIVVLAWAAMVGTVGAFQTKASGERKIMRRASSLVCLFLIAWSVEAHARCLAQHVPFYPDQTVDTQMTVSSGAPCGWGLGGSDGPIYSTHIVQRPSHGTAYVPGGHRVIYRSRPGYVGSDSFTYQLRGESHAGVPVAYTVRVSVNVTP